MAKVRELAPRTHVLARQTTRAEMRAWLKAALVEEVPESAMEGTRAFLLSLGLVPPEFDYLASVQQLMTDQLAGFYDPKEKTMHLLSDLTPEDQKTTLYHELVHALQDQHFDLRTLTAWQTDGSDRQSAVHALAEGDATSAMLQALLAPGQRAEDLPDALLEAQTAGSLAVMGTDAVPAIIKRSLLAPYVDGLNFVHWARRRGGWKAVDDLWRRMPASSEQVLHPEKWLTNEKPECVAVPAPGSTGPKALIYHDIMGEQALRILLEEWLPKAAARDAATGWAGDRLAIFNNGNVWALAWQLRFDDAVSAKRARLALHRGLLAGKPDMNSRLTPEIASRAIQVGKVCRERADLGPLSVEGAGRSVVILAGPYRQEGSTVSAIGDCRGAAGWARAVLNAGTVSDTCGTD
ncbi:MAG: hypothetical protein SFV15_06250 [Polyangiaceae bacterium]|nr:hypothetical protein [Polyangiaceae bacterium]